MNNRELDFAALQSCLQNLNHLFIDISRLTLEPGYEEKRGGYGDVNVATLDSGASMARLVAAKTIRLRSRHKEPERLAFRLARELKVWAGLQHPHILPLLGYYLDKDNKIAVLISEYMIQGDLKDYIEQEKPSWDMRLRLIRDSTDGLAYLHGQTPPIRHGDLKTGNVLINAERRAMLADFGLSKALGEGSTGLTTSEGLKGTLRYYSPELMADSNASRYLPSDIWAWACLALEVLADRIPYATKTTEQAIIIALMMGEPPSDTESLPIPVPDLKLLLAKCWTIQPSERPSAASCLRILNSVLSASRTNARSKRTGVQNNSPESDFRSASSRSSIQNIDSGVPPQTDGDGDSERNEEEDEDEYEDSVNSSNFSEDDASFEPSKAAPGSQPSIKWVMGEFICKGTYSPMHLALNVTTGGTMAVKQVRIAHNSDNGDQDYERQVRIFEALETEKRVLEKLDHPNIIKYLGCERTDGFFSVYVLSLSFGKTPSLKKPPFFFRFFEYVAGGSIGRCVRSHGRFEENTIKSFIGQTVDGLVYLHANKIIHRDIKGDNILIDPSGNCKICDFGSSVENEDIYKNATAGDPWGSGYWMAPEVFDGTKGYSAKIDVWSLGCTFIEMLTGKRPWAHDNLWAVMFTVALNKVAPPLPSDIRLSAEAEDFRLKCFAPNPEERPTAEVLRSHPWLILPFGWIFPGFH